MNPNDPVEVWSTQPLLKKRRAEKAWLWVEAATFI